MDSMTLSQRFAGCRIDDTEDSDLVAMRQKYLLYECASSSNLSETARGTTNVEELRMDTGWKDHFQKLTEKCESLTSGVCFTYLYGEYDLDNDIVQISGDRSDHDENVEDSIPENSGDGRPQSRIPDSNGDGRSTTSVQDIPLPATSDDNIPHSDGRPKSSIPDINSDGRTKSVQGTSMPATSPVICNTYVPGKVYASRTYKGCDGTVTYELTNRDNTGLGTGNDVTSLDSISSETTKVTSITNGKTSQSFDENTDCSENTKVSTREESNRNKATKGKAVDKKKVVKKFDIKPASSFPLDELLPPIGKPASKITDQAKKTNVKEVLDKVDTNIDSFTDKYKDLTKGHFQESDVFHGSVFDYSSGSESDVGEDKPDITPDSINTTSSFINSGIIPDQSYLSNYGTCNQINSQMHGYSENVNNICYDTNFNEFESPMYTNIFSDTDRSMNELNMLAAISSEPNASSMNFYNERNRMIQNTLDEIGECHSVEQCESLLNILNAQCSVLAATDEDRMKLNIMIHALRSKIMDASMAPNTPDLAPSTASSTYTDSAPSIAPDTFAGLTPTEATYEDDVGPGGDSLNEMENELFEGRTLLKGGVEPRHIPKTKVNKHQKGRPHDPRLSSIATYRKLPVKLRLPKFSVDLYGEKIVKKMIHLDWEVYFSSNKGKNLKGKDPRMSDMKCGVSDIDQTGSCKVSSPAPESMKYTLDTGNINISVQQSFLDLNAKNLDVESDVLAKLRDIELQTLGNKMEFNNSSSDAKNNKSKTVTELHQKFWNPKSMCETPMEITQPLTSNSNIKCVDMEVDDELEDGQVRTTDSDSLSDVSSVRNDGLGAVDWGPQQHSDVSMKITIPNTSFQKKEKSSTRVYRPRHRTPSRCSVTSSTSGDSRSLWSGNMESGQRNESVKRDKSSENLKHSDHIQGSAYQMLDYYTPTQADLKINKEHDPFNHSKSRQHYKDSPKLSEGHQTQSSRRRHQTSRDVVLPHNVRPELAQTMKRHHSLEEMVRKRHKSGDLISDSRSNDTIIDLTTEDSSDEHVELIHHNQPYVKQHSKKSVHERLGRKHNQPYTKVTQNVHEQSGHHTQTVHDRVGNHRTQNVHEQSGHHTQTVHDRVGNHRTQNVHEQSGHHTQTVHDRVGNHRTQNVHEQSGHQYTKSVHDRMGTQNVHEQSGHHRTKSVHDRMGTQNVHEQSGHHRTKSVHDRMGTQNVHERSGHHRTQSGSGQSKINPMGHENYHIGSGQQNVHDQLGQQNVHDRLGQLYIHEQSGNKTISTQRQPISKHQYEIPNPSHSHVANNATRQMHDDEIAKEYQQKFEISKNNPDNPKPVGKISVVRRRKSLEEQEMEMEKDKQFLQEFKMKIGKK